MEKSKAEIEKIILDFLQEHGENYFTCALATCWENEPRNTPVDARNDGLNMYFVSDPGGKLENIKYTRAQPPSYRPQPVYQEMPSQSTFESTYTPPKFCPHCGADTRGFGRFCGKCGGTL